MYNDLRTRRRAWLILSGACLAIFLTAFEVRRPLFMIGPVSFTTTELAAGFFLLTAAAWAMVDRSRFLSRRFLDLAVLLFVLSNFISVAAAIDKTGALKFSFRMTAAGLVYFGISRLPSRARSHLVVAGAAALTLLVVTLVGLMQNFAGFMDWERWLSPWQEGIFTFGAFDNVRISSTLPYPTSLAMFIELTLPLLIAAGLWLVCREQTASRRRLLQAALAASLAAAVALLVYTYTRSALVAMPLSVMTAGFLAVVYGYGKRVAAFFALAPVFLVAVLALSMITGNKAAARLGVADQPQRQGAEYRILEFPDDLKPGEESSARVNIVNTSEVAWTPDGSNRVLASYRWFQDGMQTREISLDSYLPRDVGPGEQLDIDVVFLAPPEPGEYILVIDLLQVGVGWFSSNGVPPALVPLEIDEQGSRILPGPAEETGFIAIGTPSRSMLWQAAYHMWRDYPLLGVGPDQFRARYGEYLSELPPDVRVRTNNIYLEALSNTGLAGLAAMLFLLGSAAWCQWRLVRDRAQEYGRRLVSLALMASLAAYALHGMLDNFLWQNGITFMFFAQLGLTSWLYFTRSGSGREEPAKTG
ncbi:MAG: O-antigen ligase family protein [Thermoleophilia bacterium]|nr:O-antigen ligase family protein [Thermoleophilia bacterium]